MTARLPAVLACLALLGTQASWPEKVYSGEKNGIDQDALPLEQQLSLVDEIRRWLLKFNSDQKEYISDLSITRENCEKQLKRIDPFARCYLGSSINADEQPEKDRPTAGIGSELFKKEDGWWLAPFEGGALYDTGINERVRLIAIDKRDVSNLKGEQISALIKGKRGTSVCLKVELNGRSKTVCVTRNESNMPTIEHLQDGILRIRTFRPHETCNILQSEVEHLNSDRTLTIDLRESTGGDLYEALDCAALFLPAGSKLATLKYRDGKELQIYAPNGLPTFKVKLEIIVGSDTASAAEIFAGILQYYGQAELIGEKTYGKCVSQTVLPLSNNTYIKLTNMEIRFPDGSTCQGVGLSPNR